MRKANPEVLNKIKNAAKELLSEKTASEIGMRDIAAKCGITAANIYHYYKNKDDLFKDISASVNSVQEDNNSENNQKRKKMKELSKLMDFRPSIKVVDATLRDGGLVNDFYFPEGFEKAVYETNVKAGIDYMEFGYRADKEMFDVNKFGPCKFSTDDFIRSIVGENDTDLKIAIMTDVGRTNYRQDLDEKANSPVDLVRVATYLHQMPGAIDMIENAKKKGYEVSCNIMAISNSQESDLLVALDLL